MHEATDKLLYSFSFVKKNRITHSPGAFTLMQTGDCDLALLILLLLLLLFCSKRF